MINIDDTLRKIITDVIGDPNLVIKDSTDLVAEIGMDSILFITLIIKMESVFGIHFSDEQLAIVYNKASKYSDFLNVIQSNIKRKEN